VGLLVRSLGGVVTQDGSVVIKPDPLGLLVKSVAHQDVEVRDLAVVECVTGWRFVESVLVVKDTLLEAAESVFIPLVG
jgi:hypothetical protein